MSVSIFEKIVRIVQTVLTILEFVLDKFFANDTPDKENKE